MKNQEKDDNKQPQNCQLKQIWSKMDKKCIADVKSFQICYNQHCKIKNPFLCANFQCLCYNQHQQCIFKPLKMLDKYFLKKEQQKAQLQNKVNDQIDSIIDKISVNRDQIINKIKEINLNNTSQDQGQSQKSRQDYLTGSLIYKWTSNKQNTKQKSSHQIMIQKFQNQCAKFKNKTIYTFFQHIRHLLLFDKNNAIKNVFWNPELSSKTNLISNRNVRRNMNSSSHVYMTLLQPSINKINGNIIKWKIKIIKLAGWIGLGVGLRQFTKKTNFQVNSSMTEKTNGQYISAHNKYVYCYQNASTNARATGINFITGDKVELQLNKQIKLLSLKNQRTNQKCQIKITYQIQPQLSDQYHICVSLYQTGDEIEFVDCLTADDEKYQFKRQEQ